MQKAGVKRDLGIFFIYLLGVQHFMVVKHRQQESHKDRQMLQKCTAEQPKDDENQVVNKIRNEDDLRTTREKMSVARSYKDSQNGRLRHILRDTRLLNLTVEGRVEGKTFRRLCLNKAGKGIMVRGKYAILKEYYNRKGRGGQQIALNQSNY